MAESVANILLRITGDSSDARRELELVAQQVQQFDSEEATATADVDTVQGERKLRDLFTDLARMAREKVVAKVDADTSDAVTGMRAVDARADILDAKHVDVEVDVDTDRANRGLTGFLSRLGGLIRFAGRANTELGQLSQAGFGAVTGGAGQASGAMENFSGSVGTGGIAMRIAGVAAAGLAAVLGPVLVAAVGSAVVAIAALVASLTLAAGALGVLAVGFASLLAPAVLLGVAAVERFKRTADIAGTAANELKLAFQDFLGVFRQAVAPGVGLVFEGIAASLRTLAPVVRELGPAFTRFGRAVGEAIRTLAREFARPVWVEFFKTLFGSATEVLPAVTRLFIAFARILRNMATAALPLVAAGLERISDALHAFGRGAGSVQGFDRFLAGAVPHLRAWWDLIVAIADVFLGFLRAAAPAGLELTKWLTDGARALADWVNSAEGQEEIKQFFKDTLPLVKETVELFARLALLAITAFQAIAPALQAVISQMNFWLGLLQKLINAWNGLSANLRSILFPLNGLAAAFGYLATAVGTVIPAVKGLASAIVEGLSGAVSGAAGVIERVVSGIISGIRGGVGGARHAAAAVMTGVRDGLASVAGVVRETVSSILTRVVEIVRSFVERARAAGTAVFTAVRNGIASVAQAIREAASSILTRVIEIVRSFIDNARAAGVAVFNGVGRGIASMAGTIYEVARTILRETIGVVRNFADNAVNAGQHVFIGVARGFADVAQQVYSMARGIINNTLGVINSLATAFYNAGRALVSALARGIADAAGAVIDQARNLAQRVRDILPFSEPKDRSSPLRGLADSGEAIVANLARGIANAGPMLADTLARAAAGITVQASAGVASPGVAPGFGDLAGAIRSIPGPSGGGIVVNVTSQSLVPGGAAERAALADAVVDALARGGYREAKVQVVG